MVATIKPSTFPISKGTRIHQCGLLGIDKNNAISDERHQAERDAKKIFELSIVDFDDMLLLLGAGIGFSPFFQKSSLLKTFPISTAIII